MTRRTWSEELKHHRELLRPVEPAQESSVSARLIKRMMTLGITVFLILLLLIYLVPGYDLLSILEGKTTSTVVDNYHFTLPDGRTIAFARDVFAQLQQLYFDNQEHEFSVCLLGSHQDTIYRITGLVHPRTYDQDVFHVRADICGKETLIALHSHPYKKCIFSEQDITYYRSFATINPEGLIGVMCEPDRFGFYP